MDETLHNNTDQSSNPSFLLLPLPMTSPISCLSLTVLICDKGLCGESRVLPICEFADQGLKHNRHLLRHQAMRVESRCGLSGPTHVRCPESIRVSCTQASQERKIHEQIHC